MRLWVCIGMAIVATAAAPARGADGNRLAYLDGNDSFYVSRDFPKLTTPQWVGEPGVEAVVILSIDDLRDDKPGDYLKWEQMLRPILERLKQIDGRAPLSIMTCRMDPRHPQFQKWLAEGVSLEVHTIDHPCPLLQKGDFAAAKSTYDRCVEAMHAIPGSRPVAFRMPCCDSQNTPSPRFYAEIFNRTTPAGNFLTIDSSVFNITTANDPALPRELVLDVNAQEIFRRYLPFKSYVVTVEDYPYPYVIGRTCWEFPCVVPSDWSAQHVQKPNNPRTVEDLKRALDATVIKRGVFTLVFHPHKWITSAQINELIDHAVTKHGKKVKFLNFREAAERLEKNLMNGYRLRNKDGSVDGVALPLDMNNDGYMDVQIYFHTNLWSPRDGKWVDGGRIPMHGGADTTILRRRDRRTHFGVLQSTAYPSFVNGDEYFQMLGHYDGEQWTISREIAEPQNPPPRNEKHPDRGVRLRDIDGDGICEMLVSNPTDNKVFSYQHGKGWKKLPIKLPQGVHIVDADGRDAGLRFVDIDQDGMLDVISSNEKGYAAHRFVSLEKGWSQKLAAGSPDDPKAIPMISRNGTNNGAWIHSRTLWVQNENTDELPDLVARMPLDDLLASELFPGPKTPAQSLAVTHARPGFKVELAVHEPLVEDPVSMAFGPDGRLWVCEMGDYPRGLDGKGKNGGVVRVLEDTDDDGKYDKSTVFLDDLGYPNGVTPWRQGVIVTCAPDVIFAEDTDGDGKADKREVLYSGFLEGNPQHRVNGFKWGLDGWLYGAHADAKGGAIKLHKRGETVDANGRDFRIRPDEGLLDPQSGTSQYGRSRDDWDNWFGNSNSNPMYQFVLDDGYLRRNEHVPSISGKVDVSEQPGVAEVFPRSRTIARYNDLYAANRFTSANSTIVYRDDLFGPAFEGNSFVSEPVHNLVHREVMRPAGLTFSSRRPDDEQASEFLASADNWFRPASLVVGPDGALWVADMYRQTIEHPQWIPDSVQKQIDVRAGSDMGRIYRVFPVGSSPRKIPKLDKLATVELVAALDSASGWQRDMVQQLLVWRDDKGAIEQLRKLVADSKRPITRAQSLWTLELLGGAEPKQIIAALEDAHPGVRRQAIRIAERHLEKSPELGEFILGMGSDTDLPVQLQRAYTLGEWNDVRAGTALGELALRFHDDRFITAAVLSSVKKDNLHGVTAKVLAVEPPAEPPAALLEQLVALASAYDDDRTLAVALEKIGRAREGKYAAWQLTALAGLLDALRSRDVSWEKYDPDKTLAKMFDFARATVADEGAPEDARLRAVRLLGRSAAERGADIDSLVALLVPQSSGELQTAAVEALAEIDTEKVPQALLAPWRTHGPALRSQILDALVSRPAWARVLLTAVEAGKLPAADIDASRRQRLQRSEDEATKALADKLLAGGIESNRAQVVEQSKAVLEITGDAQAGVAVFTKRCAVCHRLRGVGTDVGPNLASLTDYSPHALLVAMLDPNRAVEAKFLDYLAVTTSGLSHTGLLANETGNSVTLMGQEGKQQTILRSELEALQATGKSLMPEGLEKDLNQQDLANVIAYLRGSGAPRKQFDANHPRLVTPTTDGTLQLYPTNCEIYGPTVVMEQLYKNLGKWESENDRAVWNLELPKPGRYVMTLNYACLADDAGNTWLIESGDKKLTGKVESTGSNDRYQEVPVGEIELAAGASQIVFRSEGPVKGKLLQLGGVLLKPVK